MAKQIREVSRLHVIQETLKRQNELGQQMEVMVGEMIKLKTDVIEEVTEMRSLVSSVKEEITINYEQQKAIQSIIQSKSINFTETYFASGYGNVDEKYRDDLFKKKKGQFTHALYKRLKTHFNIPRYTSIKKIDFENTKEFLKSIEYRYIKPDEIENKASWNIPGLEI